MDLVPMSLGDLMDEAFDLYKRNFTLFLGVVSVLLVPVVLVLWAASLSPNLSPDVLPSDPSVAFGTVLVWMAAWLGIGLVAGCFVLVLSSALTVAVSERYLGRQITIGQAYRRTVPILPALLGSWVVIGVITSVVMPLVLFFIGLVAAIAGAATANGTAMGVLALGLLIVSIWFVLFLCGLFVTQICAVERLGAGRAIARNFALLRTRFGRAFGAALFVPVILFVLGGTFTSTLSAFFDWVVQPVLALPSGALNAVEWIIVTLVWMFLHPVGIVFATLLYYDQRVRREGLDLSLLEQQVAGLPSAQARGAR